jgi:hypothetical protein
LRDDRILAILSLVADVELHDEIVEWMSSLDDADWNRTVVAIATRRPRFHGTNALLPSARRLFELRFSLGPTARRITYRFTPTTNHPAHHLPQATQQRREIARARKIADECARLNP